ncbi:MAG: hypothetical protein ACRCXB_34310 [Aeromonadaceae bacterium]
MNESELNSRYTVAFVNSLHIDDCGCYIVSKADADRLASLNTGKLIAAVKGNLWIEVESVVDGELIGKKLEVV